MNKWIIAILIIIFLAIVVWFSLGQSETTVTDPSIESESDTPSPPTLPN